MEDTDAAAGRRPNTHPFARSFAAALAFGVVGLLVMMAVFGPPGSSRGTGFVFGTFLGPALFAAAITGFTAWRSTKPWPAWKYALMVTLITLVFMLLAAASNVADQVT